MNRLILAAAVTALSSAPFAALAQAAEIAPAPSAPAPAKPVAVNGDLVDTLKLSGQFNIFTKALTDTNLAGLLKQNANLTVFAPTDAAFATMPAADLAKLQGDKAALQRFVLHHVINAPVPSSKIKGTRGPWPTGANDQVVLDGGEDVLKADGASIVQADLKTGSGLLHIVDKPLIAGSVSAELPAAAPTAEAAPAAPAPKS